MFPGEPRAFALRLDPGAADQAMQCASAGAIPNGDVQTARTARQRAEVRHRPREPGKFQQACHQPCALPQRQPEQRLQPQARLLCRAADPGLSGPAFRRARPATPASDQTRYAAIRAASGRRCKNASSWCGRSGMWPCSSTPTNTLESRRESLVICATEPRRPGRPRLGCRPGVSCRCRNLLEPDHRFFSCFRPSQACVQATCADIAQPGWR